MDHRVLVVEDEPDVAGTAATAIALLRQRRPDVVLLDLGLPDLGGLEVCRRLRAEPSSAHVGVLILTANDSPEERLVGFEAGANDFVGQPFEVREIVLRVLAIAKRVPAVAALGAPATCGTAHSSSIGRHIRSWSRA